MAAAHIISSRESGTVNGLGLVLVSYSLVSERDGDKGEENENEDDDGDWCCAGRTFLSSTVTYVIQVYHSNALVHGATPGREPLRHTEQGARVDRP